jgi:F-type H+-transporting ATPase subunit b
MEMSFNIPTLVVQITNFLILLIVLKIVLFQPMVEAVGERERRIKKALDEADALNREAQGQKDQYDVRMKEARQEAAAMVNAATQEGERLKNELVEEGRKEASHLVDKGRSEVARERQDAMAGIRGQVVNLSAEMASQLLRGSMTADEHRRMAEEFVKKAERLHAG